MIPPCGAAGTAGDRFRTDQPDPDPAPRETDDHREPGARITHRKATR